MRLRRLTTLALAALVTALVVVAAGIAGTSTPATATLAPLPRPPALDYGRDATSRLPRVNAAFVQQQLGQLGYTPSVRLPAGPSVGGSLAPVASPPKQFRCVNGHQTDDPLSPPCNTSATATNPGATYQGVTSDEIRVVVAELGSNYFPCGSPADDVCTNENRTTPINTYYDLDQAVPADKPGSPFARAARAYNSYFNSRFQTFGRRVHVYIYFFDQNDYYAAEASHSTAKRIIDALHPFAILVNTSDYSEQFSAEAARDGVLVFTDQRTPPAPAAYYQAYPDLLWGYWPSIDEQATTLASYVCTKVAPNPVSMSGNGENGKPRKIGIIHGYFRDTTEYLGVAAELRRRIEACGATIADEGEFGAGNGCHTEDYRHLPVQEAQTVARFKAEGITTVVWAQCVSSEMALAADAAQYFPEWIVMGDSVMDGNSPISGAFLDGPFNHHAVVVTPNTKETALHGRRCYEALRSGDPGITDYDAYWDCIDYGRWRVLFTAIQVAGPRLGPYSVGQGMRALPAVDSPDPLTPSCSFAAGDSTCIKDAATMYWDSHAATDANAVSTTGCWRPLDGGQRHSAGHWPAGNINATITGTEPCNEHDGSVDGAKPPDQYHIAYPYGRFLPPPP